MLQFQFRFGEHRAWSFDQVTMQSLADIGPFNQGELHLELLQVAPQRLGRCLNAMYEQNPTLRSPLQAQASPLHNYLQSCLEVEMRNGSSPMTLPMRQWF